MLKRLDACHAGEPCRGEFGRSGGLPGKPITVVVLFAAGGPTDVVARTRRKR